MITIEEEIAHIISFLSHPAGFELNIGMLRIRPMYETLNNHWEVDWEISETDEAGQMIVMEFHKTFSSLEEAAACFVEKRHYMCLGLDFELMKEELDE